MYGRARTLHKKRLKMSDNELYVDDVDLTEIKIRQCRPDKDLTIVSFPLGFNSITREEALKIANEILPILEVELCPTQ